MKRALGEQILTLEEDVERLDFQSRRSKHTSAEESLEAHEVCMYGSGSGEGCVPPCVGFRAYSGLFKSRSPCKYNNKYFIGYFHLIMF